jgi:hypothetical protein
MCCRRQRAKQNKIIGRTRATARGVAHHHTARLTRAFLFVLVADDFGIAIDTILVSTGTSLRLSVVFCVARAKKIKNARKRAPTKTGGDASPNRRQTAATHHNNTALYTMHTDVAETCRAALGTRLHSVAERRAVSRRAASAGEMSENNARTAPHNRSTHLLADRPALHTPGSSMRHRDTAIHQCKTAPEHETRPAACHA